MLTKKGLDYVLEEDQNKYKCKQETIEITDLVSVRYNQKHTVLSERERKVCCFVDQTTIVSYR